MIVNDRKRSASGVNFRRRPWRYNTSSSQTNATSHMICSADEKDE